MAKEVGRLARPKSFSTVPCLERRDLQYGFLQRHVWTQQVTTTGKAICGTASPKGWAKQMWTHHAPFLPPSGLRLRLCASSVSRRLPYLPLLPLGTRHCLLLPLPSQETGRQDAGHAPDFIFQSSQLEPFRSFCTPDISLLLSISHLFLMLIHARL